MKKPIPWPGSAPARLLALLAMATAAAAINCATAAGEAGASMADDAGDGSQDASAPLPPSDCQAGEWCSLKLSTWQVSLNGIWGSGPDDVWILGSPDTAIHWDGRTFTTSSVAKYQPLLGIWGSGPNDVWTFGTTRATWHYGGDAGVGWSPSADGPDASAAREMPITAIWGTSATDVWAVGGSSEDPSLHIPTVFHCDGWHDGSPNWQPSPTSSADPPQHESVAFNAVGGNAHAGVWIVGDHGKTRYTTGWSDGHATWTSVNSHTERTLFAVWASPNGDVWAGGEAGILHRFTRGDGGDYQETTVETPATTTVRSIWGLADDDVWAIGDQMTVLHWDGTSWSLVTDGVLGQTVADLFAIWGPSKDDLWLAGRGALFHKGPVALPGVFK